ncbi:MAG: ankyrin repeat domain-containing protein [Cyclobacteriaceae bacterium]
MKKIQGLLLIWMCLFTQASWAQEELFEAINQGDLVSISSLYRSNSDADMLRYGDGFGPLAYAAYIGNKNSVKVLLEIGADVNVATRKGTPLHAAAIAGNLEIMKLIIAYGADINAIDIRDRSPLIVATINEQKEIIDYLKSLKADTSIIDIHKKTAADYALENSLQNQNNGSGSLAESRD